jgi:hypothetical protein|tara:strand:- start:3950 stop:4231 length:282 start_codon:yes stop_codon:yes gene_type:complete
MSVARITTITFESNEAADIAKKSYAQNAPNDFPEAEQLLGIHSEGNLFIAVSLYADNEAMERATATRGKALDSIQGIVLVDTKVGTVEINHTN